jgi:hypothetical protein
MLAPKRSVPANIPFPPKYQYRRRFPHFQKSDAPLCMTFCSGGPLVLPEAARDFVLNHSLRERGVQVDWFAAVVMPDSVHLLLAALRDESGWAFRLGRNHAEPPKRRDFPSY